LARAGETNFPRNHNLSVTPKKGRAVLWPSVYNESPHDQDSRSNHQALPVLRGVKYGANAWIHQRDFKGPNSRGC
jgi:prolyl 4-hydroxylase